jgi:outer membrane murein-binding lipoprotein Lpp
MQMITVEERLNKLSRQVKELSEKVALLEEANREKAKAKPVKEASKE